MMIRPFTLFCAFFAGVSGMVLYAQKHKTTQLDRQITKIVYDTQRIKSRTAMLRTEWTLLNQPDRLKDLSANFIPGLRPLNPTQFVQMSAVTNVLPPIQQDQDKDKTREQLVQNVAQNHGQSVTNVTDNNNDPSNNHKEPPIIVAQNGDAALPSDVSQQQKSQTIAPAVTNVANNTTASVASSLPETYKKNKNKDIANSTNTLETSAIKPQPIKKPVTTTAQNNSNVATVIPARRKKIKTTDVADSTNTVEAPTTKPQPIKKLTTTTAQNNNDVAAVIPTHRKKVKTTEVAEAIDAIETPVVKPQPIKRNHIENVSYNIQSGNPFSHNKTTRSQTSSSDQDNATNTVEKKNIKQTQQASAIIPKKRPAAIKVARYEAKKSTFSESALGGNSNDTLPAPVPFAP